MARPITVNIPHSLGQAEARRRIETGFGELHRSMSGKLFGMLACQERWEGDRLHFEGRGLGQTITGRLDIAADAVQIQLDLPEILAALADMIAGTLKTGTQKLLGPK